MMPPYAPAEMAGAFYLLEIAQAVTAWLLASDQLSDSMRK